MIAEVRSNSLLVRAANPARLNLVRTLVERLDQPGQQSATGNIYVVYLKNAEAAKLAVTLRAALAATGATGGAPSAGAAAPLRAGVPAPRSPGTAETANRPVPTANRVATIRRTMPRRKASARTSIVTVDPCFRTRSR